MDNELDWKCKRCASLPVISNEEGTVMFHCDVDLLQNKLYNTLSKMGLEPIKDGETLIIETKNFRQFLEIFSTQPYSDIEQEGIHVLFLKKGEALKFAALSNTKTLKKWLFLLNNSDFINIFENKSLTTYFQPILELNNMQIKAYECLTRGVKADGSLMPPNLLFKLAIENDLLFFLDRLCRENAIKTAAVKNINCDLFINFVPTSIYVPQTCLQTTLYWAQQFDFNPSSIVFEVVEAYKVEDLKHLKSILDFYREKGFKTALDDLGSGSANLSTLVQLGTDIIKIDIEIIRNIHNDSLKQSIFEALVNIAQKNNIVVLAEGVETYEELEYVKGHGAKLAQGFLFSKPLPEPIREIKI
ncbi:diguanylate phosphodiesterase [Thermodesulfobium narugense DSM 14796]|uniref:Diguanylate phosphodiesterase n=1 Tax=Thermodesulfobium narugense DSM 14796 TaxID=747365 RepID=M1E6C3_9BACT|nr:EAL domain-containing protein [Thermodesulfobium narugense]AEE14726.1 diguanylate phosphodiesterase [Thermodesulfobium narugense DSM 14796]